MAHGSLAIVAFLAVTATVVAQRIGDGFGTNIHWTTAAPGETAMLATAFRVVRMDLMWGSVESRCGQYNFTAYDTLLAAMEAHGLRPYWILDYSNSCYDPGPGCHSDACVAAYGRFTAAVVTRYAGHGIIFESVNEPNGMGADNATQITRLCAAAGPHFLAANETFVGPTSAGIDWTYLNATFSAGILQYLSGVSVHPYRATAPETVISDLQLLRTYVDFYSAQWNVTRPLPILAGEWGYTSAGPACVYGNKVPAPLQGKYVPRMWLSNLQAGVSLSIDYDWIDDGLDPEDCESNFGSVLRNYSGNASAPYVPKPAYLAAVAVQATVGAAEAYDGRLQAAVRAPLDANVTADDLFVLQFSGGDALGASGIAFAAWTNVTTCAAPAVPGARDQCGGDGIAESDCLALGCCFEEVLPANTSTGVPQCYAIPAPGSIVPSCSAAGAERRDCGWWGISQSQCASRGCCWDWSSSPDGPQCYYHTGGGAVAVSVAVPASVANACFAVTDVYGYQRNGTGENGTACASEGVLALQLTDGPTYLWPL
jgi:hypothetical protein